MSNNELEGSIPDELSLLTNLATLYNISILNFYVILMNEDRDLGNNHISGEIPTFISNLTKLEGLYVF